MDEIQELNEFIMKPKVDFCFKELMEDELVRRGFLSALLVIPPEQITGTVLLPTILRKKYVNDKLGILDVRAMMRDGSQVDIEIQVANFKAWPERSLFYLCKMFSDQIKEGDNYDNLKKCIHVGILDFDLFQGDDYYSRFHLWEDHREEMYSNKFEIHILELSKVQSRPYPESELLNWARFICGETKEDLRAVAEKDPYINEAYGRLLNISEDEQKRLEYEARLKAIRDHQYLMSSSLEDGRQMGLKQGLQEGLQQGIARGESMKLISQVHKKMQKGKTVTEISDELEEDIHIIDHIYQVINKQDMLYDMDEIYREIFSE